MTGRIFGTRLMAALAALFNALALNLAMIVASLPLITAPTAVSAASAALDRWGRDGEDRVVRQFIIEFRDRWSVRTTLGAGIPMTAAVLGLAEIRHFAPEATLAGESRARPRRRCTARYPGGTRVRLPAHRRRAWDVPRGRLVDGGPVGG